MTLEWTGMYRVIPVSIPFILVYFGISVPVFFNALLSLGWSYYTHCWFSWAPTIYYATLLSTRVGLHSGWTTSVMSLRVHRICWFILEWKRWKSVQNVKELDGLERLHVSKHCIFRIYSRKRRLRAYWAPLKKFTGLVFLKGSQRYWNFSYTT